MLYSLCRPTLEWPPLSVREENDKLLVVTSSDLIWYLFFCQMNNVALFKYRICTHQPKRREWDILTVSRTVCVHCVHTHADTRSVRHIIRNYHFKANNSTKSSQLTIRQKSILIHDTFKATCTHTQHTWYYQHTRSVDIFLQKKKWKLIYSNRYSYSEFDLLEQRRQKLKAVHIDWKHQPVIWRRVQTYVKKILYILL